MRMILLLLFLIATLAPASAQTIAITNAKIYPVSGAPITRGTVVIRDGVIVAVGERVTIPSGAQTI
ncbi:MAG: amidohydrolase family protein, partial [Pyrinomonadaceae bacterium]